jgi:hypothetical protein
MIFNNEFQRVISLILSRMEVTEKVILHSDIEMELKIQIILKMTLKSKFLLIKI